jgi:hypothetical protein
MEAMRYGVVNLSMELHAAPIAKLGARKMESYRLPFCAVIALWLLTVQVIADQRPVLGQGNISCSLWLEGHQTDSPSAASRTARCNAGHSRRFRNARDRGATQDRRSQGIQPGCLS